MAEAHDAHTVIERFIRDSSRDEIEHAANELEELLSLSQRELRHQLSELGCSYDPATERLSERDWVERLLTRLRAALASRPG